jgi:vanillate O-demethylase monooxygenase subunit
MTQPATSLIRASQTAASRMADRGTPFIYNEWYVAAFASEIGRTLFKRKLLGKSIVMYRTLGGAVVALDDRCAHRSFPLSRSSLEGDTVVCGYHGFRYDTHGDCIEVPSQATCPKGIGINSYRVVEVGPLIWIWLGDQAKADATLLPQQAWMIAAEWATSQGYLHLPASYVRLHENLLDLTHLGFLHATTLGTPDYAAASYEVEIEPGHFVLTRTVQPTTLPPVWGQPTGLSGCATAARVARSEFFSPAVHEVNTAFFDSAVPPTSRQTFRIRTAHLLTPESQTSMHYFLVHGRDFALQDARMTRSMHEGLFAAFLEDVAGLTAQEEMLGLAGDDLYEMSVPADAPAIAMRRYLKSRAEDEARARPMHARSMSAAKSA